MYRADASIYDDNAECYIHGGKFGEITGTGLEGIGNPTNHTKGNITWVIDQADITNFFGGGISIRKLPTVTLLSSAVDQSLAICRLAGL